MAHFLEADLQPWASGLAQALFPDTLPSFPSAAEAPKDHWQCVWRHLDELAPLGGAVEAVLRAWPLPLLEQLPLTPAEWHPDLLRSHVSAGELALSYGTAVLCCDAMPAVCDVHTLTLTLETWQSGAMDDMYKAATKVLRASSAFSCLRALHKLKVNTKAMLDCSTAEQLGHALGNLPQLACLDLSRNRIRVDGAVALAPALTCLTSLTSLDLSRANLGDSAAYALARALGALSHLAHLDLGLNDLDAGATAALAPSLGNLAALTFLNLRDCDLGPSAARAVAPALCRLSQLAHLDLFWSYVREDPDAALAQPLALLTALTFLNLGGVGEHIDFLAPSLGSLSRLAHLNLDRGCLGDDGAAALAPHLARLTALTALNLRGTEFRGSGAAALAPALARLTRLVSLNLCENAIGDDGARHLAPALARLTSLSKATVVPVMFGKPLLNNVLRFDHVQLQK